MMSEYHRLDEAKEATMSQSGTIRIVILGKVGVGKSTIGNVIAGPGEGPFTVNRSMSAVTRQANHLQSKVITSRRSGLKYDIRILDLLGQYESQDTVKYTEGLRSAFADEVNVILFVIQTGRLITEESRILEKIAQYCPNDLCALIITGCEGRNESARSETIQDALQDERTSKFAVRMNEKGKGVHPVGFPDVTKMNSAFVQAYNEGIERDKETISELVRNSSHSAGRVAVQDLLDEEQRVCPWFCTVL